LAVLAFLVWRLSAIGWRDVVKALPTEPWFYLIFLARYLVLPVADALIYAAHWGRSLWGELWAFIVKRAYNFGFVGLSGDLYFGVWASRSLGLSGKRVLVTVKDVNLLSAAASNLFTLLLLAVLAGSGGLARLGVEDSLARWFWIGASVMALATLAGALFRRHLLAASGRLSLLTFAAHFLRLALAQGLQALQWAVVFPEAGFGVWLGFVTAQLVLTRIPFLPSPDLLFLGLSLSLAHHVHAPEAAVAAMFVMTAALMQVTNVAVIALETLRGRGLARKAAPAASPIPAGDEPA